LDDSSSTIPKGRAPRSVIRERAISDPEFRQALVADPRSAMRAAFGLDLPEGVELSVLEESDNQLYLVLPPAKALSEQELAGVAGGLRLGSSFTSTLAPTRIRPLNLTSWHYFTGT